MKSRKKINEKKMRRVARTRAKIFGTAAKPRLAVRRSNRHIYAQLIDDEKGNTIAAVSGGTNAKLAFAAGEALAKKAVEKGVKTVVFDRRSYKFHGRVKSLADGAKKGGLKI